MPGFTIDRLDDGRSPVGRLRPIWVFVLAGQSNMVGRGFPLGSGEASDPRLLLWRAGQWQTASDPLGPPDHPKSGVGPGMTFGLKLLERNPRVRIGLVMCAQGATGIAEWQPDRALYERSVARAEATGDRVAGILFMQGERDAESLVAASGWGAGFRRTFDAFRRDLGATVPLVLAQLGSLPPERAPGQQIVRDQQAALAAELPDVGLVHTLDLPTDGLHFTVEGYRQLGARLADTWLRLRAGRAAEGFTAR